MSVPLITRPCFMPPCWMKLSLDTDEAIYKHSYYKTAAPNGHMLYGTYGLQPLEHWDCGFESY
jgi:hypothetical protein